MKALWIDLVQVEEVYYVRWVYHFGYKSGN